MLKDQSFSLRRSGKNEEIENVPSNSSELESIHTSSGLDASRPPLNAIQDPLHNPKHEVRDVGSHRCDADRTPYKAKRKSSSDHTIPLRTPDKQSTRRRFGWVQKAEPGSIAGGMSSYSAQSSKGKGSSANVTPRTVGRAHMAYSDSNSTQTTPTKSVSKLPSSSSLLRSKFDGGHVGNFAALYKGVPISSASPTPVNAVQVPHFDLREDPSFWTNHSVQVLVRVRPLNSTERSIQGYNRCFKQDSAQSIIWVGQTETRFTFDHVACETVDQEMLFRMAGLPMVENCLSGYNSCIFAYGQTGSGKTYTMLGDIENLEINPSQHRGITPRIFEFLFARIQAEEMSRRDENLKYSCKCSFLEIYNEQITDLFDPLSTNLLIREDVKKGVYVENLTEFEVQNVSDILRLLIQGSSNRKVAATNMNKESSRSHSVFTCVIESKWEKDSATNLRFARLNLVDLAGSERQKTSGAEGERLKEAANINKSLSALGHVIMVLLDVARGKPRHVPYRDSKLTFLLQDSLGGNSKTMIIANISPSMCCAAETLNTLKFAQRAKLIQNNAVVNEDSTGDVLALQNQILLLKEELSILKRQTVNRSLSFGLTSAKGTKEFQEDASYGSEMDRQQTGDYPETGCKGIIRLSSKQLKSLEKTLAGALRREQMAETHIKQLEAEIEQLNRLVRQREEESRSCKMMLRFREEKIQRMESLVNSCIPADSYLQEDNRALREEIQLLQAKVDRNPEVTRFASENIRLLDQIRRFQEFYEEGERDILLNEISSLRHQLLEFLEPGSVMHQETNNIMQPQMQKTFDELEKCRHDLNSCLEDNARLSRGIDHLRSMLNNSGSLCQNQDGRTNTTKDPIRGTSEEAERNHESEMATHMEEILYLHIEFDILKILLKEERSLRIAMEDQVSCLNRDLDMAKEELLQTRKQCEDAEGELKEAKILIEALESQQILSINEVEEITRSYNRNLENFRKQELQLMALKREVASKELRDSLSSISSESKNNPLQKKLKIMHDSLEKAKNLNMSYQSDLAVKKCNEKEMDEICRQAEAETAEVIVCMQEELATLQQQVHKNHFTEMEMEKSVMLLENELREVRESLFTVMDEKRRLTEKLEEKEGELRSLSEEWEILNCEMEGLLGDGCEALKDASDQLDHIKSSFPYKRIWISEQVGSMVRTISEKELLVEDLRRCLEEANNEKKDVECMLKVLRAAAMSITEAHERECNEKEKEIVFLTSELDAKALTIMSLEEKLRQAEDYIRNAATCATVAFVSVNRLSEVNLGHVDALKHKDILLSESVKTNQIKDDLLNDQTAIIKEAERQISELQEIYDRAREKLSEEQERCCNLEQKLADLEEIDFVNTRERLTMLQNGVLTIKSCMDAKHFENPERSNSQGSCKSFSNNCERQFQTDPEQETNTILNLVKDPIIEKTDAMNVCHQKNPGRRTICKDVSARDVAIPLLRKELESALESLEEVRHEISKLNKEKKEMLMSEKRSQESIKSLRVQVLSLEAAMSDFQEQSELKMDAFSHRLKVFEEAMKEAGSNWCQMKELLELEVDNAKIVAAQKAVETSCILAKFEEAQDTMKEADIMINGLMIANEMMKLDMEKFRSAEVELAKDKALLNNKVQSLQSMNDMRYQELEKLIEQIIQDFVETRASVEELDHTITEVQKFVKENVNSLASDFQCIKYLLLDFTKLARFSLEDVWSEIVEKDCVVSALHLCHIGILLETITGLNAEKSLLLHGLSETNSVIVDLKEHNSKARKELEMCRVLRGKLLADIKSSFDRISRREKETNEVTVKLMSFDKKISDLDNQEELMLQRANDMESQLAALMRESDLSNVAMQSLLHQEGLLKQKEEVFESQVEFLMTEWCSKDFQLLTLAMELEDIALRNVQIESQSSNNIAVIDHLLKEIFVSKIDAELTEHILREKEYEFSFLRREVESIKMERQDLLMKLDMSNLRVVKMEEANKALESDMDLLKDLACSNHMLKGELGEVKEMNQRLLNKILAQETEYEKLMVDFIMKEVALDFSLSEVYCKLETELNRRDAEVSRLQELGEENGLLRNEIKSLKTVNSLLDGSLAEKNSKIESLSRSLDVFNKENQRMQGDILHLESTISSLETVLERRSADLNNLQESQSILVEELQFKSQGLQDYVDSVNKLKKDNVLLNDRVDSYKKISFSLKATESKELVQMVEAMSLRFTILYEGNYKIANDMLEEIFGISENISKFMEQFECIECYAKDLLSDNLTLQDELQRKDDIIKGLLYDLCMLQESASISKDQKDEIAEMEASLEALEVELADAVANGQMLEAQLLEKSNTVTALELNLSRERESLKLLLSENLGQKRLVEDALEAKRSAEHELKGSQHIIESLETELSQMSCVLNQMNDSIQCMSNDVHELKSERDHLQKEVLYLKEKLDEAEAKADTNEAIAREAQQRAEAKLIYAEEKEAEVQLLERSVEELERTINALENKVDIVKGEAERQRLQREELESELHTVKHQMQNVKNADTDMRRYLDEKDMCLQDALNHIEILKRDISDKDAEIAQMKAHISELNLHAEAQASEYKQKFKALQVMAEQVKPESVSTHAMCSSSSSKLEKNGTKSRGSGSPFKCIGLGLGQQIKSEKVEELAAAKLRINELEALAMSRQKEIFSLNARLATAESMTHDVIRDLLGVKLDMTAYVSLLDNKQVQKIAENPQLHTPGSHENKQQEFIELKKQLNDFVEERQGWLDEIDRKQAEMIAAQVGLEKLQQQDQLLKAENDMLKAEIRDTRKKLMELEGEVKNLSGQQNLQQRIRHHARIKEENNMLKMQNEDLSAKLRKTELLLSRVKGRD